MNRDTSKTLVLFGLMLIVILVAGVFFYLQLRSDKITDLINKKGKLSFLVVVHDGDKQIETEYVLMDTNTDKMGFLDIPGNTGTIIKETNKVDRIDSVFNVKSPDKYKKYVEDLIGDKIDFVFSINIDDLSTAVNLIDGVDLFIANPVEKINEDKILLLPSGSVLLDGSKSVDYLSYHEEGEPEVDRVGRRQKFLESYYKKMNVKSEFLLQPEVFSVFYKLWDTKLDKKSFMEWLKVATRMDVDRVVQQRVLGVTKVVDGQELLFPHYDSRLIKETVEKLSDTLSNIQAVMNEDFKVSVEILNGTSRNGLASRTAQIFQSFGIEVNGVKNADQNNYENTVILDHRGNSAAAERVAKIIQCDRIQTTPDDDGTTADITIILGRDFDGRYVK
ncbi:LCP family protein [Spirochaeta cellobiosiphila]|uniref:LCP family protein n=1 Tax=Spirochaeta cellobiosiphila TaxID=504483 RepID=UPI000406E537|nr:LCP family protein [Spirochaeta cellobiosiphila]